MNISIEKLIDNIDCVDIVVNWMYKEWGNNNYQYWNSWIRSSLSHADTIPQTYIVKINNIIAGTYSLWRCDLQSRQDLFPWFGGLFVDEAFRGKKYNGKKLGEIMQADAIKRVKQYGLSSLYLFTEKDPDYYVRNGWVQLGTIPDENDKLVWLCKYDV